MWSQIPKRSCTPALHLARQRQQVGGAGATAVGQRQGVLGRQGRPVVAVALAEARVLDQPRGARLDRPVRLLPARGTLGHRLRVDEGVGEEGAGAPGVVVLGVEHHALAGPQPEHGLADRPRRRARARLDVERAGELGVAHRGTEVAQGELEGDLEDDEATGVPLEPAGAVAEAAVGDGEGAVRRLDAVPAAHGGDRVGDLLAVGADVLHRGGADRAGDAGERLDAHPALLDRPGDQVVPDLAGGDRDEGAAAGVPGHRHAAGRDPHDGAVEALVGDDEVAAAGDEQDRRAGLVAGADGVDELVGGRRLHPGAGGPAETQGGVLGEAGLLRQPGPPWAGRGPSPRRRSPRGRRGCRRR